MENYKCDFCGNDYKEYPSNVKNNIKNFCSNKCKNNSLRGQKIYRINSIHLKPGDTLKNLTLVKYTIEDNRCFWECKCDCGNIVKRREDHLKMLLKESRTISCGCKAKIAPKGSKSQKWRGVGKLSGHYFCLIQKRCKNKNLELGITIEDAWNLFLEQNEKCALSGIELTMAESRRTDEEMTASLDRKDSEKGYIKGNVQWVHKDINLMKNILTQDRFIELCRLVTKNNPLYSSVAT
jgi:hypothetical protein